MIRIVLASLAVFAILLGIYIALDSFMRWNRKRELEAEYRSRAGQPLTRDDYIGRGLAEYERSTEKKLLLGVFLLPLLVIGLLAFFLK